MKPSLSLFIGLLASSLTVPGAFAKDDDKVPDHTLKEFTLGDVIHGDKAAVKNLDGKVVALEMWGIH